MSDIDNPYQSPAASTQEVKPLITQGTLTDTMFKYLSDTSPWLRFIGIMGFIGSALMVLGGVTCAVFLPIIACIFDEASPFFSSIMIDFSMMVLPALYLVGAGVLMFIPALYTFRFGTKIRRYVMTNSESELELAFKNNKSLWKFQGILMIIGIAAIPVMIVIGIIVAVAAMAIR